MAWLSGYSYRKKVAVNSTAAGAQTLYQLDLVVGESSGASGEDVDCSNHCQDFPNDIRFTKEDGETKHDYWIESGSLEGTSPNRKVTVWIEVASIPASGSVDFYMYYGKTSDSGESNGGATFNAFDDFGESSLETMPSSEDVTISANGSKYEAWPAIAKYSNGDLFVAYRTCNTNVHGFCSTGKIVIRKSTDSGQTWGSEVTVVDATNIDDRNPDILIFDDDGTETILIVYDEYDGNTANDKAYSVKSTDSGVNWSSKVSIGDGTTKGRPILLSNGKILVPYRLHDTGGYVKVGESNNGGDSWTSYNVTNTHVEETAILELKTNGSYTGKVIALIADDTPSPAFWKVISTDYGHTWGTPSEETQLPCDTDEPIDIIRHSNGHILGAYTPDGERSGTAIYESEDECETWIFKAYAIKNDSVAVGEYPSICEISTTNLIVAWCSNQFGGSTSNVYANFIDYPLPTQWCYTGTPTVGSGELSLNADDLIYCIRFFGYGYAVKARSKADEQDITFVQFRDGAAYQNALQIVNSDSQYPNDFDMMLCQPYVGGTSYYNWINDQLDFRNVYRYYEITRISGEAKFYQDGNLMHTETTHLPTVEMALGMRVWDSSQASTLIADWILLRKYSSPEPTWGSWQSEETDSEKIGTDSGIGVDSEVVDKGYEDFTTFTEVDVGADRIQKTIHHIDHLSYRNEETYVYKDYGADFFGDFTHKIKLRTPTTPEDYSYGCVWALTNDLGDMQTLRDGNKSYINIFLYRVGSNLITYLRETHNGTTYQDTNTVALHTDWRYIKIIKSGTTLTAYIYSDAEYSTLVDTLTLTMHVDGSYKYLYGCSSLKDANIHSMTTDIENFDIGEVIIVKTDSDTGSGVGATTALAAIIPPEYTLDSMDATTDWQAQAGMTSITVNTTTKKEGIGALNLIKDDTGDTDAYIEKTISSTNLTSKYVKVWLYLKDATTVAKISRAQIYLYDTSNNYRAWDITDLATGWNLIIADTESTPDHQSGTPGNLAAITTIELDVDTNQETDTYAEGDVIADYYHYNGFDISDSGSGTESEIVTTQIVDADVGAGLDVILESLSSCLESDTGAGVDMLIDLLKAFAKYSSDTGSGADAISDLLGSSIETEAGVGLESIARRGLDGVEGGSGADAISSIQAELKGSDLGAGVDTLIDLLKAMAKYGSDEGSGAESEVRALYIYLALKLLQMKELNIILSQRRK